MRQHFKLLTVLMVIATLITVPLCSAAMAQSQSSEEDKDITAGKMTADLLLCRPLGLVATVLGGAIFIVSLPFSALGGNHKEAYEHLLANPARYTFKRPLGDV
jgi:hypothetical protein